MRLNKPIFVCIRDRQQTMFKDSIRGIIQSNLHNGIVYFDCFPRYPIGIKDINARNDLVMEISSYATQEKGTTLLIVQYRITFKLTNIHQNF